MSDYQEVREFVSECQKVSGMCNLNDAQDGRHDEVEHDAGAEEDDDGIDPDDVLPAHVLAVVENHVPVVEGGDDEGREE